MSDEDPLSTHHDEIKRRGRLIVVQRFLVVMVTIVLILCMVIIVFTSIQGYLARKELLSCTQPQGSCHKQGEKDQRAAIEALLNGTQSLHLTTRHVAVVAAYCADKNGSQSLHDIESCVELELIKEKNQVKEHHQ